MTPEEKAIIDAKREGFCAGMVSNAHADAFGKLAAELFYPYPKKKRRREVMIDGSLCRIDPEGDRLQHLNGQFWTAIWGGSYARSVIATLHDLYANPDEEVNDVL